jgi:ADP-ribose pyrophosphatase YjhB (NUDIX family)
MIESSLESMGLRHLFRAVRGSVVDKAQALGPWLDALGLSRDETAAVGDMPHDLAAARAAGIASLGVTYGYGHAPELSKEGPDGLFDSLEALTLHFDKARNVEARQFPIATVGGLIKDEGGRVLLVRTRKWGNRLGIPGGKIDYGETMEAAFAREAMEETGLALTDIRFAMVQDCVEHPEFHRPRHFILVNYTARAAGRMPPVKLNHESQEALWVEPGEALGLDLNGPTRALLLRLGAGELT